MPTETELLALLPPEVSVAVGLGLVFLCFFSSALTAIAGIGGGMLVLTVLITVVSPATAIPVHAVVQLASNSSRAFIMREHVRRAIVVPFSLGSVIGVAVGARLFVALPVTVLEIIIAVFVLWATWAPKLKPSSIPDRGFAGVGAASSFLTMFIGATGPFLAAFLSPDRLPRDAVVATHGICMTVQHTLKIAAFGFIGFAFLPWAPVLTGMVLASVLGSVAGRRVMLEVPERAFKWLFKLVLTGLALKLGWSAIVG